MHIKKKTKNKKTGLVWIVRKSKKVRENYIFFKFIYIFVSKQIWENKIVFLWVKISFTFIFPHKKMQENNRVRNVFYKFSFLLNPVYDKTQWGN